jgi:UDP-N-acetylmuramate: L-alanyl-gamma-D-glutamyl-meso-diaminopimelate ligase
MAQISTLSEAFGGKRIHVLGVAGTLMGAFAALLKRNGITVTGSDQNIYPPMSDVLKNAGIECFSPFSAENLDRAKPDLVIVGNVIRKTNPEMEAVTARGIPYQSLPSALEKMILPHKHPIVVAGTHGKTTTSSIMTWILEQLGEQPSFFVGGVLQNFSESFRITDSKYMVLEGDEYDTAFFDKVPKFTHYLPRDVILTSIEYDHADIYPNIGAVIAAFEKLADITSPNGYFVACAEYETPLRIAHHSRAQVLTYGLGAGVDSRATNIDLSPIGANFNWTIQGQQHKVKTQLTGKHNVLNALACLTLAHARKLDVEKCIAALATYKGVKRRQEVYGQAAGITLIDDFAHHPTAVRETISAIRAKYPSSRLVACFEPRSATSRRRVFQNAYSESFDGADLVFVAKPYEAATTGTPPAPNPDLFSTEELLAGLQERSKRAKLLVTNDAGIKGLARELKSGDVVLVMSNGSFDGLLPKLLSIISK